MTFPAIVILIGASIVAIGTFWNTSKQERDKTQSAQQRLAFEQEIRKRSDEQLETQREITKLNRLLAVKSDEIAMLNAQIVSEVRGSGFCYLSLSMGTPANRSVVVLLNEGQYPIHDVQIRIVDIKVWDVVAKNLTIEDFINNHVPSDKIVQVGLVSPNQARPLDLLTLPADSNRYDLNVFFQARHSNWTQFVRFKKISTGWRVAWRIIDNDGRILGEKALPDFPRNEQGDIDWSDSGGIESPK